MATEVENNVQTVTVEIKDKEETTPATTKAEEAAVTEKQEVTETPAPVKEPPPPKVVVHKSNYEKDVVYLYQFSRTPLLPSISSYCLKVESWLRLAGLKYEVSPLILNNLVENNEKFRGATMECVDVLSQGCCPVYCAVSFIRFVQYNIQG